MLPDMLPDMLVVQRIVPGLWVLALLAVAGCADHAPPATQPSDHDRQASALNDPFNVGMENDPNFVNQNALGGSTKSTMKQDVDRFWNP